MCPFLFFFDSVYLDYNATTPLEAEVLQAIHDALKEAWGNPSSSYKEGKGLTIGNKILFLFHLFVLLLCLFVCCFFFVLTWTCATTRALEDKVLLRSLKCQYI